MFTAGHHRPYSVDMESECFKEVQRKLLNDALNKASERNEQQANQWRHYEKGHEKVANALAVLVDDPYVNCMVPIGRKAFVKGKLIHTNEVLACLGDGYFAKYSVNGAIRLCQRRITRAAEMLDNLQKERDLYEMRQIVTFEGNAFEDNETKDITELWEEKRIDDWKKEHREREKEYRKKLAEVKDKPTKKIENEQDLFERLDQLELEEELEEQLDRLESGVAGSGSESESDGSSTETDQEDVRQTLMQELHRLEEIRGQRTAFTNDNTGALDSRYDRGNLEIPKKAIKKNVSFAGFEEKTAFFGDNQSNVSIEEADVTELLRIEFEHSNNPPRYSKTDKNHRVTSPRDLYEIFSQCIPKPILKRRPDDLVEYQPVRVRLDEKTSEDEDEDEDEDDEEDEDKNEEAKEEANDDDVNVKLTQGRFESVYETVVKDIKERPQMAAMVTIPESTQNERRPVSKFKRERCLR